jgi:hypothetical protein
MGVVVARRLLQETSRNYDMHCTGIYHHAAVREPLEAIYLPAVVILTAVLGIPRVSEVEGAGAHRQRWQQQSRQERYQRTAQHSNLV